MMEAVKVKICGLMREQDILAVNEAHPDFAGMILAKGFRRSKSVEDAEHFRKILREDIPLVGVFVNDDTRDIADVLNRGIIDIAQLHGEESEDDILRIKELTGKPVWKVFKLPALEESGVDKAITAATKSTDAAPGGVQLEDDSDEKSRLTEVINNINSSPADFVLLDAGTGLGKGFDHNICKLVNRPFILAGGLNPENVEAAILETTPYAVDTSSGVETDGQKDADKISAFVNNIRRISNGTC